uniref:Uncharacterized protein n=1 Tax=Cowpox virus TaxID=10243 RepID=A0A0K2YVE2_COWPX|nr:hypothetical protein pCPXV0019 [Cowpox virus]
MYNSSIHTPEYDVIIHVIEHFKHHKQCVQTVTSGMVFTSPVSSSICTKSDDGRNLSDGFLLIRYITTDDFCTIFDIIPRHIFHQLANVDEH